MADVTTRGPSPHLLTALDAALHRLSLDVWECGRLLSELRAVTPHGQWRELVAGRGLSESTALNWMNIHRRWPVLEDWRGEELSQRAALAVIRKERSDEASSRDAEPELIIAAPLSPTIAGTQLPLPTGPNPQRAADSVLAAESGPPVPTGPKVIDAEVVSETPRERRAAPPSDRHPARYTAAELAAIEATICERWPDPADRSRVTLLDPMAGEGTLLRLSDSLRIDWERSQLTDITAWPQRRPEVKKLNALAWRLRPDVFDAVVLSPPYGNRMADPPSSDGDNRATYADRRGTPAGADDVSGMQWGAAYRRTMRRIWDAVVSVLRPGRDGQPPGLLIIAVADHIRAGRVEPVVNWHLTALLALGLRVGYLRQCPQPGHRGIRHDTARVGASLVIGLHAPDGSATGWL